MPTLVTRQEERAQRRFQRRLAVYLNERKGRIYRLGRSGTPGGGERGGGKFVGVPEQDILHLFDNDAMLAVSHAIEDLASETREGELISTFQQLKNFLPQKKRYLGLARELDAVRVWGEGVVPRGCARIDFIPLSHPGLRRYWMVLFSSGRARAVLVCRQVNDEEEIRRKIFAGFYSFKPLLVESIRRRFNQMSVGLDGLVAQWEREFPRPMMELEKINALFRREETPRNKARPVSG